MDKYRIVEENVVHIRGQSIYPETIFYIEVRKKLFGIFPLWIREDYSFSTEETARKAISALKESGERIIYKE